MRNEFSTQSIFTPVIYSDHMNNNPIFEKKFNKHTIGEAMKFLEDFQEWVGTGLTTGNINRIGV